MAVELNHERCEQVGRRLALLGVPDPVETGARSADEVAYDLSTLNMVIVSICHQTQRLSGEINGKLHRGWDYLQSSFQVWANQDPLVMLPGRLATFSTDDLRRVLNCGNQIAESDLEVRSKYVRDCGIVLEQKKMISFNDAYERCRGRIAELLLFLCAFSAFRDPVRKKSLFLLGLNATTCKWRYEDYDLLDPPVDYHEIRGHIRLGTVHIVDDKLYHSIRNGHPIDESADIEIRSAITQAIRLVGRVSGFKPMQLHYAFWNLFRSICSRQQPKCQGNHSAALPQDYQHFVSDYKCCFIESCDSANATNALDEYVFHTDWY